MMKKRIGFLVLALLMVSSSFAFADLSDTRATIAAKYGDFRIIMDDYQQMWTKTEWDAGGYKKAKANSYLHQFRRNDLGFQMEVMYDGDKADAKVRAQRFTPDMGFRLKELKDYLPEVYELVTAQGAQAFTTETTITNNFRDKTSPITLGVLIKSGVRQGGGTYNTQIAFSIMDEGRYVRDAKFINQDTYIQEIVIERVGRNNSGSTAYREPKDPIVIQRYDYMKENIFSQK